ncbi:TPA: hypothetical protein N0F65_010875, partial [Lagenidium giganteum]
PNATPELLLEIMEKNPQLMPGLESGNPKLAEALKTKSVSEVRMVLLQMHMEAASRQFQEQEELSALEANPFDTAAQAKIEERIRLSNVQKNMEIAIEEMPEAFARVYMLYIPCEVNGIPVKAFVDSGAQSTIMSSSCAERCGIMRLVDKRFAGQAVGVGTAKIIGRVHMAPLKIGNYFYNCSFTILDQQNVDFLFGLDMLKRHQCCIDLHKNVLRLHDATGGHEVEFLPEHEIPMSERSDPAIPASPLEREKELSSKRRKMRDEFLQKEKDAELRRKEQKDGAKLQSEMKRLREKMMMQRQEMAESMARDAQRRRDAGDWKEGDVGSKSQRTVSFKWDSKQFSHSDDTISRALREYGAIDSLKVKGSSAKVLFASKSAAAQAVRVEGHKDCWRSVSLKGHIVDFEDDATGPASETKHSTNYLPDGPIDLEEHLAFERLVLQKLRDRIRSHEARESVGVS